MSLQERKRIVIVGAGFAGVNAARALARLLPREKDCEITLVDQNNFHLFTPMLTEVAGGTVDTRHILNPVRRLSPRVTFAQGRVESIDLAHKSVSLTIGDAANGVPEDARTLEADHLVIALGSITADHHIPGVREHGLTVKSVGDAAAIRNRAIELLDRADAEPDPATRRALLTFVVGGGGYTGVETLAAVNDLVRESIKKYPRLDARDVRSVIVEPVGRLMPEISAGLGRYAQKKLQERGVEVIFKELTEAGPDYVALKDGTRIPTYLFVWAGGIAPNPLVTDLDCARNKHGAVVVDACMSVPGHPGVWALGDCAEIPGKGGKPYTATAQNAQREGVQAARNIVAAMREEKPQPFVYTPIGEMALVGKRSGVAQVYGLRFSGVLAWAMWRAVYLAKTPLPEKRIRILLDWALDLLFGDELAQLPTARSVSPAARDALQE